jgi:uncharacterized radical SAM superfamily protein
LDESGLDASVRALIDKAWQTRLRNRPREMRFDSLLRTRAVSVTGSSCGRNCAHCGGHYLGGMLTATEARRLATGGEQDRPGRANREGIGSWLVSGGCDRTGRVPLLGDESLLWNLGRRGRLNLHAGLVRTEEEARAIARHATTVSLDFVVDKATIEDVYGFDRVSGEDFLRSYELLAAVTRVLPHVVIGLRGGVIDGELTALAELARLGAGGVVLLVLIPTQGSRYSDVPPPRLSDVARVMAEARLLLPHVPVGLGCMRPKGRYRGALDVLAVLAGLDRIAVPTPAAVREAEALGLRAVWSKECCAFRSGEGCSDKDLSRHA